MKCFFVLLPMLAVATVAAQDVIDGDDVTVPSATHPAPWAITGELIVGDLASASLIIEGDGEVDVGTGVTVGAQSGGSGAVELQGGSTTRGVLATEWVRKGDGDAALLFQGGIVRAKADEEDFLQGFESGDITIGTAHAFIDSGGFDIGIGASLQGAGSVTKEGAGTLTLTGDHAIGRLYIGRGAGAPWLPLLDGGTVHLHDEASLEATYLHLGGVRGKGALYLSGAGTRAEFSNNALIGAGGPGEVRIENGAMLENQSGRVGQGQEGGGSVLVSGAGSLWRNSGDDLYIGSDGSSGTGELRIEQGARVESARTRIGNGAAATGIVTVTGADSSWETLAQLEVGRGGEGTLLIEDGAIVTSRIHLSTVTGSVADWWDTPLGMVNIRNSGSWDNHGAVRIGRLGSSAGIVTLADGGRLRTGLSDAGSNWLSLAGQADSSGTLNIGAAADEDAAGAGVLEAAVVQFGDGDGRLVFNHTEADYPFDAALVSDIDGGGVLLHQAGNTTLGADSAAFTGITTVAGGRLTVNGQLGGTLTVETGATLAGTGTVGDTVVVGGGTLAPGNSIGTLTINGDLTLADGAICDFEFGAPGAAVGASDSVAVSGDLTLGGAVLNITDSGDLGPGMYRLFEYGGTLAGGLTVGALPQDFPYVARIITAVPGEVRLLIRVPGPLYVDHSAAGANNGESWDDAFADPRDAFAIAGDGDEIWVAGGQYQPDPGDSFELVDGVAVYGGFDATESALDERDWQANPTTLAGFNNRVILAAGTGAGTRLDGFTVTGGLATGTGVNGRGGGIHVDGGAPVLANLVIRNNHAGDGGGGGLAVSNGGAPLLINTAIINNESTGSGGGLFINGSQPALVNVTFTGNLAGRGGAIGSAGSAVDALLHNTILWGNQANVAGQEISHLVGAIELRHSLYRTGPGVITGGGELVVDEQSLTEPPLYADAPNGDLRLLPGSPAIFAGTAEPYDEDGPAEGTGADLAGNPRLIDGMIDIGAYQNPGFVLATTPEAQSAPQGATYAPITVTVTPRDDTGFIDPGDYPLTGGEVQTAYPETGATVIFDGTTDNPLMLILNGYGQADTPEPVAAGGPGAFEIGFVMPGADAVSAQMQNIAVHTVTAEAQGQGTITPPVQEVVEGENAGFAVTPAEGWHLVSATGDTCTPSDQDGGHWMAENIAADCHVTAIFAINEYTVTAGASDHGTITPAAQTVNHGDTAAFDVIADTGYTAVIAGTCPPGELNGQTYVTGPVTADCEIAASFITGVLAAEPGEVHFEDVVITRTRRAEFRIVNHADPGEPALELTGVVLESGAPAFAIDGITCKTGTVLLPGEFCRVEVSFEPRQVDWHQGHVRIATTDGQSVFVDLSGSVLPDEVFIDRFESP